MKNRHLRSDLSSHPQTKNPSVMGKPPKSVGSVNRVRARAYFPATHAVRYISSGSQSRWPHHQKWEGEKESQEGSGMIDSILWESYLESMMSRREGFARQFVSLRPLYGSVRASFDYDDLCRSSYARALSDHCSAPALLLRITAWTLGVSAALRKLDNHGMSRGRQFSSVSLLPLLYLLSSSPVLAQVTSHSHSDRDQRLAVASVRLHCVPFETGIGVTYSNRVFWGLGGRNFQSPTLLYSNFGKPLSC